MMAKMKNKNNRKSGKNKKPQDKKYKHRTENRLFLWKIQMYTRISD